MPIEWAEVAAPPRKLWGSHKWPGGGDTPTNPRANAKLVSTNTCLVVLASNGRCQNEKPEAAHFWFFPNQEPSLKELLNSSHSTCRNLQGLLHTLVPPALGLAIHQSDAKGGEHNVLMQSRIASIASAEPTESEDLEETCTKLQKSLTV